MKKNARAKLTTSDGHAFAVSGGMRTYVALLRAVNVGGTGALPMKDLIRLCAEAGFARPETYIASGNVVFEAEMTEAEVKAALGAKLGAFSGKAFGVIVRSASEIAEVIANDPFKEVQRNFAYALFLPAPPSQADVEAARGRGGERLSLGKREIYIAYPEGMGKSKLTLPASRLGTARNMNTVAKLAAMAAARR